MELKAGAVLQQGKYRILSVLGQGGFGITYLAEQSLLGRKVAIKEFFMKDLCNRNADTSQVTVGSVGSRELVDRFRQKFIKEARNIASLEHKHIVPIIDVFEENGTAYYVMKYFSGGSLSFNSAIPEDVALRYINQLASALRFIHQKRMMHLDIKPSNILLDDEDNVVLIDFGLAKQYDNAGQQTSTTPVGISHGYAPIEQYRSGGVSAFSPATDIYSLGATLYKLLTGTTPPEAMDIVATGVPACPANVSAETWNAVKSAMQPAASSRPQSVDEFLSLLSENGTEGRRPEGLKSKVKTENGKNKEENDGETELNGNVKGENVKLVADKSQSIDVVKVPDSADTVISNEGEKSHSADAVISKEGEKSQSSDAVILSVSEESQPANNEILDFSPSGRRPLVRSAQNDNSANGRQNNKDGNEEVERRNEKERSAGAVISNGGEKSQKNKPGKFLWLILLLLLIAVAGAWFLFGGAGNGDASKRDTKDTLEENPKPVASLTTGKHNGHDWVDLGLPSGLKWATCNVGASSPSDYGDYYAWGETSTKSSYTDGNSTTYGKEIGDIAGNPTYDVARAKWGGSWRLPTLADFYELLGNCIWEWTTQDGHKGHKVTSRKNGNSIFLPAAGWRGGTSSGGQGSCGDYWSATPHESNTSYAHYLYPNEGNFSTDWRNRSLGHSVRPVFQNN